MALRLKITSRQKDELGDDRLREFVSCGGTIGRALDNDWVLPDAKRFLSSRHALIDYQAGAYYLVDTSRNGVFINGADTAVGRGHPQRLFDGDRMRMGEYEIVVEITAEATATADDGMRDSVVRAQLVPIDESMEFKLVDEKKMRAFEYDALEKMTRPDAEAPAPAPARAAAPVAAAPATATRPPPAPHGMGQALDVFCKAAGVAPADLHGQSPEQVLENAGALLRELVIGLADLLNSRANTKDALNLPQTIIQPSPRNPLKISRHSSETLRSLLGPSGSGYLPADLAVHAAFQELRHHQQALYKAMIHAMTDYSSRLDPGELRTSFDRSLNRSGLLASANRLQYWELYEQTYRALTDSADGSPLPRFVNEELGKAYEQELAALADSSGQADPRRPLRAP